MKIFGDPIAASRRFGAAKHCKDSFFVAVAEVGLYKIQHIERVIAAQVICNTVGHLIDFREGRANTTFFIVVGDVESKRGGHVH